MAQKHISMYLSPAQAGELAEFLARNQLSRPKLMEWALGQLEAELAAEGKLDAVAGAEPPAPALVPLRLDKQLRGRLDAVLEEAGMTCGEFVAWALAEWRRGAGNG